MDEQIKLLEEKLASMSDINLDGDMIQKEIFKPKSDIAASIVKFECKQLAIGDVLAGLKKDDDITDIKDFLKNVRKLSAK